MSIVGCRRGLGPVHAHQPRHTAATLMLAAGASLPEIGQVLRHRQMSTTAIYAKVDHERLGAIADDGDTMTTQPSLRQALTDYLALRRARGFKLKAVEPPWIIRRENQLRSFLFWKGRGHGDREAAPVIYS